MSLQGGLLHKKDIRSFYLEMLSMIASADRKSIETDKSSL